MIPIVVVGHPARSKMAQDLVRQIEALAISWDDNNLGAAGNHQRAWGFLMDMPDSWVCVLEDDAVPCVNFRRQLNMVLRHAPGDIVSLYLGRTRPDQWQLPISSVISQDVCFLRAPALIHAVGYAVRTNLLKSILHYSVRFIERNPKLELVDAISNWARRYHKVICYSRPSLVNHRDGPSVINDQQREDGQSRALSPDPGGLNIRKAWVWGPRKLWDSSVADIPPYDLRRKDKVASRRLIVVR